jgi:hypothetical protein
LRRKVDPNYDIGSPSFGQKKAKVPAGPTSKVKPQELYRSRFAKEERDSSSKRKSKYDQKSVNQDDENVVPGEREIQEDEKEGDEL